MSEPQAKQPAHTVILELLHRDAGRLLEFIRMASRGITVPTSGLSDTNVRISAFVDVLNAMVIPEKARQGVIDKLNSLAEQLAGGLNSGIYELRTAHNELATLCSKLRMEQGPPSVQTPPDSNTTGC